MLLSQKLVLYNNTRKMAVNNDELDRAWKEAVLVYFKVPFVWRKTTKYPARTLPCAKITVNPIF
jgi:hypothetical protein